MRRRAGVLLLLTGVGLALAAGVSAQVAYPTPGSGPAPEAGPSSSTGSGQVPAPQSSGSVTPPVTTGSDVGLSPTAPVPASAVDPAALAPNGAIEGTVVRTPVCAGPGRPGEICDAPYQATLRVRNDSGVLVAYFESDVNGRFFVMLPPGTYTVEPGAGTSTAGTSSPGRMMTAVVTVSEAAITSVRVEIDTGIR